MRILVLILGFKGLCIACAKCSDSEVWREVREEKNKEEEREKWKGNAFFHSQSIPHPFAVFFCSLLFTSSPLSELLEQAVTLYMYMHLWTVGQNCFYLEMH